MTRRSRIVIAGAAGGQGATTVAVATAALLACTEPTVLVAHDPDPVCGITAVPQATHLPVELVPGLTLTDTADQIPGHGNVVIDAGVIGREPTMAFGLEDGTRWAVLRGPCYLSLRRFVAHHWPADAIVLLAEPTRALRAADVEDVTGLPVIAELTVDPATARAIDAGLFLQRLPTLRSQRPLARRLDRLHEPAPSADAA